MKKLLLLAAFALVASPAFAQSNTATVTQTGDGHDVNLLQSAGSAAGITQQSSGGTDGNTVLLTQSESEATISQTGNGNRVQGAVAGSQATQSGGSSVTITQVSVPDASAFPGNNAIVEQTLGAQGTITQNSTTGPGSTARLRQEGASTGIINQTNYGAGHSGYVYQVGDDNFSTIIQDGGPTGGGSNSNLFTFGDENDYYSNQQGTSHVVFAQAWGDDNRLTVNQDGVFSGHTVTIRTDGDGNQATITQTHGAMDGGASTDNVVRLYVTGDDNSATIQQHGENNLVGGISGTNATWPIADAFGQDGNGNALTVMQQGEFNTVLGSQSGMDTATVTQMGDGNTATVTQQ